jgi:hypothetical protein
VLLAKHEKIQVKHLAIDTPSKKSLQFLGKHYNLTKPISQSNNFVVYDGFFEDRMDNVRNRRFFNMDTYSIKGSRSPFNALPPINPVRLFRFSIVF